MIKKIRIIIVFAIALSLLFGVSTFGVNVIPMPGEEIDTGEGFINIMPLDEIETIEDPEAELLEYEYRSWTDSY